MPVIHRSLLGRAALLAAGTALAAVHAPSFATRAFTSVAIVCPVDSPEVTPPFGLTVPGGGHRLAGRWVLNVYCPVFDDFAAAPGTQPSWRWLTLQYRDPNVDARVAANGRLIASLYRKSRSSGKATLVASVASVPSALINNVSVALPAPLDTERYAHYIVVRMAATATNTLPAEFHMLSLSENR